MNISTDQFIVWQNDLFKINYTILFTWFVMFVILVAVFILRLILTNERNIGKLQNFFEILITGIEDQINKMGKVDMKFIFPFIATLFIFILFSNLLQIIPFFNPPTASLSTTIALAIIVIIVGLFYGIKRVGIFGYIKKYINEQIPVCHPQIPFENHVTHVEFYEPTDREDKAVKNAVIIPPGAVDRSPCGTGTSAKLSVLAAKEKIKKGESFVHLSILGGRFDCRYLDDTEVEGIPAVIPEVTGRAWVTGIHTFLLDPEDIFQEGYQLA